jgi:hypothetical protein
MARPVLQYLLHYLIKLKNKTFKNIKYTFHSSFSTGFVWNIFYSKKNWPRYDQNIKWSSSKVHFCLSWSRKFCFINFTCSVLEVGKVLHIIYFKHDTPSAEFHRVQNMFANFQHTNCTSFLFLETVYSHSYIHPQNRWRLRPGPRGEVIRGRVKPTTWISTSCRGQYCQHYLSMDIILTNTALPNYRCN